MKRLTDIPIKVVPTVPTPATSRNALPLLYEIATMLERLLNTGATDCIDLRRAPLSQEDYVLLKDTLGRGEVSATVAALGQTEIYETALPGVWWVVHYDQNEQPITEFLEVAKLPELLKSPSDEIRAGLARLHRKLSQHTIRE